MQEKSQTVTYRPQTQIELVHQTHSRSQCSHCFNNIECMEYEMEWTLMDPYGPLRKLKPEYELE